MSSEKGRRALIALASLVLVLAGALVATSLRLAAVQRRGTPPPGSFEGQNVFAETLVAMSGPAVEAAVKRGAVVLLPVGVIEQHGPHMSLGIDLYLTYEVCRRARRELERRGVPAVIAPPSWVGVNVETGAFPGSMDAAEETVSAVIRDELASLRVWGFRRVLVVNLHADAMHRLALAQAVGSAGSELAIEVKLLEPPLSPPPPPGLSPTQPDRHAGAYETGLVAAIFPGEVDTALARALSPQRGFAPLGYLGDPAHFSTAGAGEAMDAAARAVADALSPGRKRP